MKMPFRTQIALFTLCAFGMTSSGCIVHEVIKPTELPKVNNSYSKNIGSTVGPNGAVTPIVEKSVVHLERPDGTMVEIKGETDALVTLRNGTQVEIEHPVAARTNAVSLFVKGGNIAEQEFEMREIDKVEVSQISMGRTMALTTVISLAVSGAVFFALISSEPDY